MKNLFLTFALFCLSNIVSGSDLNFVVVNATSGSSNGSVDLTVTGGVGPFTYSWSGPAGYTANTEDIAGLDPGSYNVTVTDLYCGVANYIVIVNVASNITETNDHISLSVFPNPGTEQITLTPGKSLESATFKLINVSGKTIMEKSDLNGSNFIFDISEQAPGIYFIEINNAGSFSMVRFVKS